MSFMDDFEEANAGIEVDLSHIPGFEATADDTDADEELGRPKPKPAEGDEADAPEAKYVSRRDYETLQGQMGELKDLLLKSQAERPAPQIQYVQQQPQQNPADLKAALEQQYYADPVGFTARMAQQSAQNSLGGDLAAVRQTLTENMIQNYTSGKTSDPAFKAARKAFEDGVARVPRENLSRLAPHQVTEFLDITYDAALGKVYKQVIEKQRKAAPSQPNAPAYGGGGGGAGERQRVTAGAMGEPDSRLAKALGLTEDDFAGIIE